MPVSFHRVGPVAYVELDSSLVDAMGIEMRRRLADAVSRVALEGGLDRVVLSGKGRAFAAGGDVCALDEAPVEPHLVDIVAEIEASMVPWIAAVDGEALGAGCELVLGCRYRIASPGSKMGLPDVTLGVVPGAGASQRLPRLVGLNAALDLIATGRPVAARAALELGLIDEIAPDPVLQAARMDLSICIDRIILSQRAGPADDPEAMAATREMMDTKMVHQIAPREAVDLVAASVAIPFAEGMVRERETFMRLRGSEQARALRHISFAERAAMTATFQADGQTPDIRHCVVVGGGTMGTGIACALLNAGIRTTILETDDESIERARENIEIIIAASLKRGLIDEAGATARRGKFAVTDDYSKADDADLAIEAAFESMEVKKNVFGALERVMRADAVLATNTSCLDINEIARELQDPARLVGLHFFAPAHRMKLLEIVQGRESASRALALGYALAGKLGKVPVLAGVCDGFIGNRILARYREAADILLMDGTNPWELDEAMVAFGYAMGPYEAQDLSGLDIAFANRRRQDGNRNPNRRYIPVSDRMVEEGRLGRKVGVGWYRYPGGGGKVVDPLIEDLVREEAYFAKVERIEFSDDEIRRRLLLAMINEAADILDEGIAHSARDIDLMSVFGFGFPRWRGGLMWYADALGAEAIYRQLRALSIEDPLIWKPSRLIEACAKSGRTFSSYRPGKPQA